MKEKIKVNILFIVIIITTVMPRHAMPDQNTMRGNSMRCDAMQWGRMARGAGTAWAPRGTAWHRVPVNPCL